MYQKTFQKKNRLEFELDFFKKVRTYLNIRIKISDTLKPINIVYKYIQNKMVKNLGNNSKKINTEIQKKSFLKLYSELIKLGWIDHNNIYVDFGIVYNIYNNIGTQLIKYLYWDIKIIPERIYIVILNFINILKNKNNIKE